MRALLILGVILLILFLIGCIPLGVDAAWNEDGLALAARVWLFSIRLGGAKQPKRAKPARKKKEASESSRKESKQKKLPPLPLLKILAKNGYNTLCRILSQVKTDLLKIHFTSAFSDPAVAALAYGAAGTAMEGLLTVGGRSIRSSDLWADVDFNSNSPMVDVRVRMTIRIRQLFGGIFRFGFGFLRDYLRYKKEDK